MEVNSQEQKTFTYTLSINSSELDALLAEYHEVDWSYDQRHKKMLSLFTKLESARDNNSRL